MFKIRIDPKVPPGEVRFEQDGRLVWRITNLEARMPRTDPFWWHWSSWATEIAGGAGLSALLYVLARITPYPWNQQHALLLAAVIGAATSVVYEAKLDSNGWSWVDVGQRAVGQVLGLAVLAIAFGR